MNSRAKVDNLVNREVNATEKQPGAMKLTKIMKEAIEDISSRGSKMHRVAHAHSYMKS